MPQLEMLEMGALVLRLDRETSLLDCFNHSLEVRLDFLLAAPLWMTEWRRRHFDARRWMARRGFASAWLANLNLFVRPGALCHYLILLLIVRSAFTHKSNFMPYSTRAFLNLLKFSFYKKFTKIQFFCFEKFVIIILSIEFDRRISWWADELMNRRANRVVGKAHRRQNALHSKLCRRVEPRAVFANTFPASTLWWVSSRARRLLQWCVLKSYTPSVYLSIITTNTLLKLKNAHTKY